MSYNYDLLSQNNGIILEIDRRLEQSLNWIYHRYQGGRDFFFFIIVFLIFIETLKNNLEPMHILCLLKEGPWGTSLAVQ